VSAADVCLDWPIDDSCAVFPASTAGVSGLAIQWAGEILYQRSGQQFGLCTTTIRPCRRDCYAQSWPWQHWYEFGVGGAGSVGWPYPYLYAGQWFNLGCGGCPGTCSCTALETVRLPEQTVSVEQVLVDGAPLVTGAYMVYDQRLLVRTDGGRWPLCNDLSQPDTETGTWSITLTTGVEVPALGQQAAAELAVELAQACVGGQCRLPSTVQQVVRQGVTQTRFDPNLSRTIKAVELIGLRFCDLFLRTYNPNGYVDRMRIYSPDSDAPRRVTWP
jgi:hypothetical protein